jgi:hypothetical protein
LVLILRFEAEQNTRTLRSSSPPAVRDPTRHASSSEVPPSPRSSSPPSRSATTTSSWTMRSAKCTSRCHRKPPQGRPRLHLCPHARIPGRGVLVRASRRSAISRNSVAWAWRARVRLHNVLRLDVRIVSCLTFCASSQAGEGKGTGTTQDKQGPREDTAG